MVNSSIDQRQRWMRILARVSKEKLTDAWLRLAEPRPDYQFLKSPEIGTVMVRGRAGGTGMRFNLGEMTVTRCVVQISDGHIGHAYVAGSDHRHAELAAVFDALLQDPSRRPELESSLIAPWEQAIEASHAARWSKVAPTKVDFFTMVRGDV